MQFIAFCKGHPLAGFLTKTNLSTSTSCERRGGRALVKNIIRVVAASEANSHHAIKRVLLVMKLTTALLFIGCLHLSARTVSQTITLSGKDLSLQNVFAEIEKQTGYLALSSDQLLKKAKPVTISVVNEPVEDFIRQVLKDQPFEYTIKDKTISIREKPLTVGLNSRPSLAFTPLQPPPPITGIIRDAGGNPLQGVNIIVKGTKRGTTTDGNGRFNIQANAGEVLLVSSVGYKEKQIVVGADNSISISLELSTSPLDEIQIIAYGSTTKRLNTGNVSTVKADVIEKQPVNNPLLALQGRVPGLVIEQATGFAGTGVKVRIQGQNSLNYGNDPLYIIDGVPYSSQLLPGGNYIIGNSGITSPGGLQNYGNPLSLINPMDIESIDILKDADATAIYGSRAANGAILITTKKGKAGDTRVSFNLQSGWGKVPHKLDLMNATQYLEMRREAMKNDGIIAPAPGAYGDNDLNGNWDSTRNTDWQKELIGGTALYRDLNVAVSGGSDRTIFLIGINSHKETTVFPGDFADNKTSLHFNINNSSANKKFNIQLTGSYLLDNNKLPYRDLTADAMALAPVAPALYNADGSVNWQPDQFGTTTFSTNPIGYLFDNFLNETKNLTGNAMLSYRILPGLFVKSSFGYVNLTSNTTNKYHLESIQPEYLQYGALRGTEFGRSAMNSWTIEPQLTYNRKINKGTLELLFGATIFQNKSNGSQIYASGFSNDMVMDDILSATALYPGSSLSSAYKYNAVFGRFNYNWEDKYILNLTGRRDGSSRFGPASQFHNFAAVGAAWIFSNETVIKDHFSFLSFGKLRGSYGTTGSDQIGEYRFLSLYNPLSQEVPYQGVSVYQPNVLTNPYLEWEATKKLQFGLELGFLKDRVLFGANYYRNRSSNQLQNYNLPQTTGFNSILRNQPFTIQNSGWELTLSGTALRSEHFTWAVNVNVTIPKTLLVAYPNLLQSSDAYSKVVGKPLGVLTLLHYLGVDSTTGVYTFEDKNGKPTTSPGIDDYKVLANPFSDFYGGIQNSFSYKGFQLDFLFSFVKQIAQNSSFGNKAAGSFNGGTRNQLASLMNRWQKPGDIATIQRFTTGNDLNMSLDYVYQSDAGISDASYMRLKNLSLSWQLPQIWKKAVHLQNCTLFTQGQNLWTITNYTGLDPETKSSSSLPPLRVITIGIKIGL